MTAKTELLEPGTRLTLPGGKAAGTDDTRVNTLAADVHGNNQLTESNETPTGCPVTLGRLYEDARNFQEPDTARAAIHLIKTLKPRHDVPSFEDLQEAYDAVLSKHVGRIRPQHDAPLN